MILDDCLLEIDMSSPHSQLAKMLVKMRHHKISIIVISQYLKSLHPIARAQFSHYITFSTSNSKEIAKIKDEVSSTLSPKQFIELYNFCTDQRYGYMLVIFSFPVKYKFFKGSGSELHQLSIWKVIKTCFFMKTHPITPNSSTVRLDTCYIHKCLETLLKQSGVFKQIFNE